MLPERYFRNKTHKQKDKFVAIIPPEKLTTKISQEQERDRIFVASWLFLIGSLIFMADGVLELTEGVSIHAIFHNTASLLFTIGSIFFLLDARQK